MEITYYGANCFRVNSKNTTLVVDDNLKSLGLKHVSTDNDAVLYTQRSFNNDDGLESRVLIDGPGEYELDDTTILGIQARSYTDREDEKSATIYKIMNGEYKVLYLGHVQAKLDSKVLEKIGVVDVLIVPVGGSGYTLDSEDASDVVKLLSPKITVPSHYDDEAIKYDVPMRKVDEFLQKMGVASGEKLKSLKLKGDLEEAIVVLEKQ